MSTLLKPFQVRQQLLQKGVTVFTPQDFQRIFQTTEFKAKYFLETYTRHGLFLRLKKGLYTLKGDLPPEEEIANLLYRPSYLSFEYALAAYNILPESTYALTSATTKPTRTFEVEQKRFAYLTIKPQAFTGYTPAKRKERTVLIAEPEKALVDYLYFVSLGKKPPNERFQTDRLDSQKAWQYAGLYQRPRLNRLIQEILPC